MIQDESKNRQVTISLQNLKRLSNESSSDLSNQFAYTSSDGRQSKLQLIALDTKKIPSIPIRRVGCPSCINKKTDCSVCKDCKDKLCCRNLACIFDYNMWLQNPKDPIYSKCPCIKNSKPFSTDFDIDWRLTNLIEKIPKGNLQGKEFFLCFKRGIMWISEEDISNICQRIYYEDNFGQFFFHEKQIKEINSPGANLSENNSLNFTNLLKVNIKRYLSAKQSWEVSNLQEECQQIAENFYSNRKMELIKAQFQSQENQYANMPSLKYQGKYTQSYIQLKQKNEVKKDYTGCSETYNQHILFYFCAKNEMIFVRNAKYHQQDEEYCNIRGIKVKFIKEGRFDRAVWFKDRKGDIFAVIGNTLSIFKYHIKEKIFRQYQLIDHPIFSTVNNSSALVYIHQKDRVYYFNANDFKKSFFFTLYRPKNQEDKNQEENKAKKDEPSKLSCTSVTMYTETFLEKEKSVRAGAYCKATYIMEDYKFKKGKETRRQLIPVIYLFIERKNYLPLGIGMHKIIHHDDQILQINELPSINNSISQSNEINKTINFNAGVLFTLRYEKSERFYFFTIVEKKCTLLNAKINQIDGKYSVVWNEDYKELNGCSQNKFEPNKKKEGGNVVNYMVCNSEIQEEFKRFANYSTIQVTDMPGISSNNELRMLGEVLQSQKIVQFYLTSVQGVPEWRIYDIN